MLKIAATCFLIGLAILPLVLGFFKISDESDDPAMKQRELLDQAEYLRKHQARKEERRSKRVKN